MLKELRIYDIGYFGNSHESIGIIIGLEPSNETITVLDITDPRNRKETSMHYEMFVATKNISDIAAAHNQKSIAKPTTTQTANAKIEVVKKTSGPTALDLINWLYTANQEYGSKDFPNRRQAILEELMNRVTTPGNKLCINELLTIKNSPVDIYNRVVTLVPDSPANAICKEIWVVRLSYINKSLTIHEATIRYEFNQKDSRYNFSGLTERDLPLTPNHGSHVHYH